MGGLLPKRFPGNKLANFTVQVQVAEQHTVLHDFPQAVKCAVFDRGNVRIETDEGLYRELLKEGVLVIHGDAKRHDVLQMAGILQARGICIVIDNDSDNLYITVTARSLNPKMKIITRAGQQRYANAIRNSGADEVVIPEYEGGLMTGRLIQKYYPLQTNLE